MTSTTAQLRRRPRLIVHTGDGKGKSTAAFGLGLRGWACGWSIGVFQFIKSGKWHGGERTAYEQLAHAHESTGVGGPVEWQCLGPGQTWLRATARTDQQAMARAGWDYVRGALAAQRHDLYILDEFNHVLAQDWLDVGEVVRTLTSRPGTQHVVITGRHAPDELIAAADLVTTMTKIKHPFDKGERGQAGVEW